jgi:catechol 2,3-dioxygenase-like lactoylglutathione lyase family enzyme
VTGVRFEGSQPILRVEKMETSLRFYVDLLGFKNADWGSDDFTSVSRDRAAIYLCQGRAAAGRGFGSVWKTSRGFMRNAYHEE